MSISKQQQKSLHLYLELVAETLDREGRTMQDVVKAIKRAEIRPTKMALKEVVWKPLFKIISGKDSTTQHDPKDLDRTFEAMNKWLGEQFEIHVPFPTQEIKDYESYVKNTQNINNF